MSISSKELNYLIWRYLQESDFSHATYAFQHETEADRLDDKYGPVTPVGLLVSVLQKGLQYMEIESQLNPDGTEKENPGPFSLFSGAVARSQEFLPDGIEHESNNIGDDVAMTDIHEDSKMPLESREKVENANVLLTKATEAVANASSSAPSRKHHIVEISRQPSPDASERGSSEEESKRMKISHNRTSSVATADICQPIHPTGARIGSDSMPEQLKPRRQVMPLPEISCATDCAWSSDGSHLAISTSASEVFVYMFENSTVSARPPQKLTLASSPEISSISLTSSLLAIGTYSGTIQVWDLSEKVPALKATLSGFHSAPVLSAEFMTIDGRTALVTIDCLRRAGVWDISVKRSFWFSLVPSSDVDTSHDTDEMVKDAISDVKFLSDRHLVATTTGKNGVVDIYDLASAPKSGKLQCTYKLKGHTKVVNVLYYSSASETLPETFISGSEDNSIRVWDLVSRSAKYILEGHHTGVMALKLCVVGDMTEASKRKRKQILVSGDFTGRLRLWDLDTGAMIAKVEYSYPVFAFGIVSALIDKKFKPNGNDSSSSQQLQVQLLTGSKDGIVNMWDVDEMDAGQKLVSKPLEVGLGGITAVAVYESNTCGGCRVVVAGRAKSCLVHYWG
ncbi:WD40-repeat-containing domain protein [Lipomyces tetrasporus]|uniref:WD40-repeat-containing domain protein n=1 Tax=Lipomyces tetrasporus TaxID=54092 RepID=A0AAD7QWR3_9ASCO|nr:WD40-repeat-containing domain protein [Lipomyces tetrasporus]KAJ8102890.1 WD40-repeat-containing domain protein [Lipomyces tetrasporus]